MSAMSKLDALLAHELRAQMATLTESVTSLSREFEEYKRQRETSIDTLRWRAMYKPEKP